jgi:hypothetical protein
MSLAGANSSPFSRPSSSAYATRSRCTAAGNSPVSLTGLSSGMAKRAAD